MKSIIIGLFLEFIILDIKSQIPPLPYKKEVKEFMTWLTSEYFNSIGFHSCIDASIINPDSLMMWNDSNVVGIHKWPRASYYGAFKGEDLDYAREQTKVLLQRRRYLDSIYFSQLDSGLFLRTSTRGKSAGYSADFTELTFGSNFAKLSDKWTRDLLNENVDIVQEDTGDKIMELSEIEENRCGQWVSYPIFSKDHKSVFLVYYNLLYENRHDDIALFEYRYGHWSLKEKFNYWEGIEPTTLPDRDILKK